MPRKRKFKKGSALTGIAEFQQAIEAGEWLYWHDAPKHPGFLKGMTFQTIVGALRMRQIFYALPNE